MSTIATQVTPRPPKRQAKSVIERSTPKTKSVEPR